MGTNFTFTFTSIFFSQISMSNTRFLGLYITICVLAFIVSKITIAVLCYRRWQKKQFVIQDTFSGGKLVLFRSPKIKTVKSNVFLKKTMKLTNKDQIGSGGYGMVYKVTIDDLTSFAVKKLRKESSEHDRGFERELEAMGDIKHRNIVRDGARIFFQGVPHRLIR